MESHSVRFTKKKIDYRNRIVAFDIEATGYGFNSDVVQFSMINENRKQLFNVYTCPLRYPLAYLKRLLKKSSKVNHITYDKIAGRKPLFFYKQSIQKYLNNADVIVGFSIHNDVRWLNKNGIYIPSGMTIIDVQRIFKVYNYLQKDQSDWDRLYSLSKCAEYCGFSTEAINIPLHNSLGDAEATLYCYEYLISRQIDLSVGRTDSDGKPLMKKEKVDSSIELLKHYSHALKDFSYLNQDKYTLTDLHQKEVNELISSFERC